MRFGANSGFGRSRSRGLSNHPILIGQAPTASQHSIKLDDHCALVDLCLRQGTLGREQQLLRFQHFEVACPAREIALHRDVDRDFERLHGFELLGTNLLEFFAGSERVGYFLKGSQGRLLVPKLRFLPNRNGLALLRFQTSALKNRSRG